jgi:hypothetical protein
LDFVSEVRNFSEWKRSLRNFSSWLGDAVPGATDLDFICERNGRFLVLEAKDYHHGVQMPYGQHKALYRLSQQPNTRLYLVGEAKDDVVHLVNYNEARPPMVRRRKGTSMAIWEPDRFIPTTKDGVRLLVQSWWEDAA